MLIKSNTFYSARISLRGWEGVLQSRIRAEGSIVELWIENWVSNTTS